MKIVELQSHSIKELDDQIALSFLKNLKTQKPKIVYSSRPFSVETEEWLVGRPSRGRLATSSAFHSAASPYKGMWRGPGCITTAARTGQKQYNFRNCSKCYRASDIVLDAGSFLISTRDALVLDHSLNYGQTFYFDNIFLRSLHQDCTRYEYHIFTKFKFYRHQHP